MVSIALCDTSLIVISARGVEEKDISRLSAVLGETTVSGLREVSRLRVVSRLRAAIAQQVFLHGRNA